jgi:molecular chaperone GrpE
MSEQPQQASNSPENGHSPENGAGAAAPSPDLQSLQQALSEAEARVAEQKDLYYRALAELENVRKRAAREVEQAQKFALERFAGELLGVKDSLDLALATGAQADAKSLLEGTEATLRLLVKVFEQFGIEEVNPVGQPFNPELHEAMAMQESTQVPANHVLQVIQKGYQLNGRLLRPARVIVSRAQ